MHTYIPNIRKIDPLRSAAWPDSRHHILPRTQFYSMAKSYIALALFALLACLALASAITIGSG